MPATTSTLFEIITWPRMQNYVSYYNLFFFFHSHCSQLGFNLFFKRSFPSKCKQNVYLFSEVHVHSRLKFPFGGRRTGKRSTNDEPTTGEPNAIDGTRMPPIRPSDRSYWQGNNNWAFYLQNVQIIICGHANIIFP